MPKWWCNITDLKDHNCLILLQAGMISSLDLLSSSAWPELISKLFLDYSNSMYRQMKE